MSLANDFLKQARSLATRHGRPSQINLRRAVSAAYYAVFHLLIQEAVEATVPDTPSGLRVRASRAFQHSDLREVCKFFQSSAPPHRLATLFSAPVSTELQSIADTFVSLQAERHAADYDTSLKLSQSQALLAVVKAESAFTQWRRIKARPVAREANVFLAALVFGKRWDR